MTHRHLILVMTALAMLLAAPGCGGTRDSAATANPPAETSLAAQDEICETLPPADSAVAPAADTVRHRAEPKTEPKVEPQPPPKPKALPRMWDYGSDNCLPCKEMETILNPMMQEYAGKVDIRIINVYRDREQTQQARIQVIPTQIFYDPDGKELYRHIGVYPRDSIVAKFREFGWE